MTISLQSLNDDGGFARDIDPSKVSLQQIDVVDAIMRDFAVFVMSKADEVAQSKISGRQFADDLQAEAQRLQTLFYNGQARWNTPEQLGKYIVESLQFGGDTKDAVERVFRSFCHELVPVIASFHKGETPEEQLQMAAEELIERYRHFLMGIPLPHNYFD